MKMLLKFLILIEFFQALPKFGMSQPVVQESIDQNFQYQSENKQALRIMGMPNEIKGGVSSTAVKSHDSKKNGVSIMQKDQSKSTEPRMVGSGSNCGQYNGNGPQIDHQYLNDFKPLKGTKTLKQKRSEIKLVKGFKKSVKWVKELPNKMKSRLGKKPNVSSEEKKGKYNYEDEFDDYY
ncbi:hypothetical protein PGT21_012341 [Puccinia graminis f. sp. tritici]|uniref:Uncharacterized protein n=1 Tax=Puccinia graminis f. sp. tritici TaxID=56615 RepID=A0A5B0RHZ4_PUCGR|nr:hypothetical protein PGT21_012341 [Puccinia graminis f. sp. tritici]KAA1124798.1 hypothetical protein PGTUg99_035107 [Puccinia graminis f. sp. tritici]